MATSEPGPPPLATENEIVIDGTDISHAILAAALASRGHSVLHVDRRSQYGGMCHVSHTLEQAQSNLQQDPYDSIELLSATNLDNLMSDSKFFALDIVPGMVPCDGDLVHLLRDANVGRYIDFKLLEATFVYLPKRQRLEKIPATKEDVFQNKMLSLMEKRRLMKCLTFIQAADEEDCRSKWWPHRHASFATYLQEWLPEDWINVLLYAFAGADSRQSALTVEVGLKNVQQTLKAMTIYGPSAYLLPMYGVSEIAQAFCRVGAIYGATYRLSHKVDPGISTKLPVASSERHLVRHVLFLDRSISATAELVYVVFPPETSDYPIYALQVSSQLAMAPKDIYVVHLSTLCLTTEEGDRLLYRAIDHLLAGEEKPKIMARYSFAIKNADPRLAPFDLDRQQVVSTAAIWLENEIGVKSAKPIIQPLDDPEKQRDMEESIKAAELAL